MNGEQSMLRIAIYRGGTSKGIFLLDNDLPASAAERDRVILRLFGSPDPRQIDGLGGADSLTSKVAIIGRSEHPGADVDYTFGQVSLTAPMVDYSGNCGNISSAVGPFAIDEGLVKAAEPTTRVRIHNTNTNKIIVADVPVTGGKAAVAGDCVITGVPGAGARILLDFPDSGGSVTGSLLPTGREQDTLALEDGREVAVSIVDAGNPCVFAPAEQLGIPGTVLPAQLAADPNLLQTLEEIRSRAAAIVGLVESWHDATRCSPAVPKMILVSEPADYESTAGRTVYATDVDLVARAMSMQRPHKAYPITGTICTGVAAHLAGTIVHEKVRQASLSAVRIGHPAGVLHVDVALEGEDGGLRVQHAIVERTARRLLGGYAHLPDMDIRSPGA